ncbi:unnamed protein product, partial [Echinostoma caproni]|uniref:XPG_I_2 domain-containing protein n=1 Tax=Echinostoma caproni TaxID=27848 RepID=A0A183B6Z0_9TREM
MHIEVDEFIVAGFVGCCTTRLPGSSQPLFEGAFAQPSADHKSAAGLKLNTLLKRNHDRITDLRAFIQRARQISDADDLPPSPDIAPKLMNAVFLDVLRETGALYISCEREADVHVAELACFLHCPVVSNDSDFYIFRPNCSSSGPSSSGASSYPYQLISLVSLGQPHRLSGPGCGRCSSSSGCYALPCSMFRPTDCPLGKIYPPLLPVLATLIGNDFISAVQVPPVVSQLISDPKRSTRFPTYTGKRIDALVEWLARFGQDTTGPIRAILDLYSPNEREPTARHMREIILDYVVQPWETGRELASRLRLSQSSTDHCSSPVINCSGSPAPRPNCDPLNSKLPQLVDLVENVLPKPGRKILSAIHRVEDEKISHGWPHVLIEKLHNLNLPTGVMDTLYVRTGSVQRLLFEDMLGQSESIYHVLNPLRLLFYNLLFGLELHCHTTQKLCGVQNKLAVEYRRRAEQMLPFSFSLSVLTVPHCDDVHSIRNQSIGFLLTELGLPGIASSHLSPELKLIQTVVVLWFQNSQFSRQDNVSLECCSVPLAFVVCALTTHAHLAPYLHASSGSLDRVVAELCESLTTLATEFKNTVSNRQFSIQVVHQINELQLLMLEMKHLVNLVEGLMRNNHTAAGLGRGDASSSSSSVSMPPIGWSNWIHFPSCRLIYWFVSCLQEMRPHSRFHNAVDVWLPRVNQAFRSSGTAVDLNELKRAICDRAAIGIEALFPENDRGAKTEYGHAEGKYSNCYYFEDERALNALEPRDDSEPHEAATPVCHDVVDVGQEDGVLPAELESKTREALKKSRRK